MLWWSLSIPGAIMQLFLSLLHQQLKKTAELLELSSSLALMLEDFKIPGEYLQKYHHDSSSKTLSLTCSKKLLSWWNCLFRTFRVCSLLELLVWVSGLLQDHFRMANFICQVSLADDSLFFCTLSFLPKKTISNIYSQNISIPIFQFNSLTWRRLLMELSQNYVKLLSLSSLSKNTWQNENLQSRYFNSSSLHTTLPSLLAVPKCPVVFTVYCCSPVFLPPAQWRPSSPAAWRDDSSLSMSDTGSSGVPATKVTSKHTLSRRIIWCNCKKKISSLAHFYETLPVLAAGEASVTSRSRTRHWVTATVGQLLSLWNNSQFLLY